MKKVFSIFINTDCKPQLLDEDREGLRKFYSKHSGQWIEMTLESEEDRRTNKMNKKYWAILNEFVPDHFNTADEAHDFFTKKYLLRNSLINSTEESLNEILYQIKKEARKILSFNKTMGDNIEIIWIKSTASLSKKDFSDYLEKVMYEGTLLGFIYE